MTIQTLKSDFHTNHVTTENEHTEKVFKFKAAIHNSMPHLAYFTLHSNLLFEQFSTLLATVNKCGLNFGDINHKKEFVPFLDLVNDELLKKLSGLITKKN